MVVDDIFSISFSPFVTYTFDFLGQFSNCLYSRVSTCLHFFHSMLGNITSMCPWTLISIPTLIPLLFN